MSQLPIVNKTSVRQTTWFIFLRIALGVILIWKGINFINETSVLESVIKQSNVSIFTRNDAIVALVSTILTLLCGLFITVGLVTRVAAIIQLLIFSIGAILYIHGGHINRNGFELVLTVVVPFLLLVFFTKGSGAFSVDEYLRRGSAFDKKIPNRHKKTPH